MDRQVPYRTGKFGRSKVVRLLSASGHGHFHKDQEQTNHQERQFGLFPVAHTFKFGMGSHESSPSNVLLDPFDHLHKNRIFPSTSAGAKGSGDCQSKKQFPFQKMQNARAIG
jgi:hypothetical protein